MGGYGAGGEGSSAGMLARGRRAWAKSTGSSSVGRVRATKGAAMADPVTEFELYRQELLGLLADDNPVVVLRDTLVELERVLAGVSDDELSTAPEAGEWSLRDVFSLLADSDLVTGVRVRMIVTQDRPALVGYDQDAWTMRLGEQDPNARETIERWQALRRANLRVYESLSD